MNTSSKIYKYTSVGIHNENQDHMLFYEDENVIFISLADGVSTEINSKTGAIIACEAAKEIFVQQNPSAFEIDDDVLKKYLVDAIKKRILDFIAKKNEDLSTKNNDSLDDYASTLAVIAIEKRSGKMIGLCIGDSFGYGVSNKESNDIHVVAKGTVSAHGSFATTTNNVEKTINICKESSFAYNSVFLMSDGAWRFIFDGTKMNPNYAEIIKKSDFNALSELFDGEIKFDDCSFISINLTQYRKEGIL